MAQSVTQPSDSRWAEDNPLPLPPSSVSFPPSLSVLLTSPIPRCNDTAEGFFSRVTWPELQRADAGERNPADSARVRRTQPESAAAEAGAITHCMIFNPPLSSLLFPSFYLSITLFSSWAQLRLFGWHVTFQMDIWLLQGWTITENWFTATYTPFLPSLSFVEKPISPRGEKASSAFFLTTDNAHGLKNI